MTIGARIRNEGGSLVQIDPFYENLALRQTASVTTSQLGPSGRQALIGVATIQLSGCNEPLLMVKCDSEYVGLRKRTQNGSTYTWEILASTPVVNIQYWIFDTTNVAQMAFNLNQGLRIRSPDGTKVIFDSRYKYMRILSVISLTLGSGPQSVTTPINTGFAIALSNPSLMTIVAGGSIGGTNNWLLQHITRVAGFRTGNGEVSVAPIETNSFSQSGTGLPPYADGNYGSLQAGALVCDVRNY